MNETDINNKNDQDGLLEINMISIKTEIPENQSNSSRNSFSVSFNEKDRS